MHRTPKDDSSKVTRKERRNNNRRDRRQQNDDKFFEEPKRNISIVGKTKNQKAFIASLYANDLILARGIAGCGKTYCSIGFACKEMQAGRFKQIILARPNIPTGSSLGFFPGTVEDKLKPWLAQQLTYIEDFVHTNVLQLWIKNGQLKMIPLETIRGRSFTDSCVIADEMQNADMDLLKCVSTRIGENSKLILCGDSSQSDLRGNAFDKFAEVLIKHNIDKTDVITFTVYDCVRSGLCRDLLFAFEKEKI